jgi:hypothetical protein
MKLVDAEITQEHEGAPDIPRPARPARRRVYTSLLVTLSVLFGTVGVIYKVFPNRHDEVMTLAMQAHLEPEVSEIQNPTGTQIRSWSLGVFGEAAPWPEVKGGLVPKSATALRIFKRDMAIVRYELDGQTLTLAMLRKRDPMPRTVRRTEDGFHAVSWAKKRFTRIAIGPQDSKDKWTARLGAP